MDAVGRLGEVDPGHADRIVSPARQVQDFPVLALLEMTSVPASTLIYISIWPYEFDIRYV
jgi:hypothetical protein